MVTGSMGDKGQEMVTDNLKRIISDCEARSITLAVDGDKLLIQGGQPPAAIVRRLSALLETDRATVLATIGQLAAPVATMLWDLPAFDQPPAVSNPDCDAQVTPDMLSKADLDPQDPTMLAHYQHYVGKVVADEVVTRLIHDANRHGFSITFEAQGDWRNECDYLVTSARFAYSKR